MPKRIPEIYIDVHEVDSGLPEAITRMNLGTVEVKAMETGDVVIRYDGYDVGIEIKRLQDYSKSLYEKRMSDQIYRLIDTYSVAMVIIEGWKPYYSDESTEESIRATVNVFRKSRRKFNRRVIVEETADMEDTLEVIESIINDIRAGTFRTVRRPIILEPSPDKQIVFLAGLPNVSVTRATEILELFGSPGNAITHVDEWDEVNGITKARVDRIKEVLTKELVR